MVKNLKNKNGWVFEEKNNRKQKSLPGGKLFCFINRP
jgi:hypothetical protein